MLLLRIAAALILPATHATQSSSAPVSVTIVIVHHEDSGGTVVPATSAEVATTVPLHMMYSTGLSSHEDMMNFLAASTS